MIKLMETSSVLFCNGYTSWKGLLLSASLLSFWYLSTTAHVTIESIPPLVAEGDNVLFLVYDLPENIRALAWFKGLPNKQEIATYQLRKNVSGPGLMNNGRKTIYQNGSLLLSTVNLNDTGIYILQTYNRRRKIVSTTSMYLHVHDLFWKCGRLGKSSKPTIESVPSRVAEGRSALLRVHNLPENIVSFAWFKGMIGFQNLLAIRYVLDRKPLEWGHAYSGREMLYSDGSLLLNNVNQKDRGLYTLQILRTDTVSEEARVELQVDTSHSGLCSPLISSQLMIVPVPPYADKKEGVLLQVHNLPEDFVAFFWYKSKDRIQDHKIVEYVRNMDSTSWGPAHRRRVMVYNNASLMLHDVTEKDEGMYTLEVLNRDFDIKKAYVEFYLKRYVTQPFVQITDTTVTGGTTLIFTCISPDTDISIRWIFNNKNLRLTERITLSPTKCGLRIDPVRSQDAGEYKCEVSNKFSLKTSLPVSWP